VDGEADYEIAIIGLGPVGAVAANLAGKAGFRTLVVERSDDPYRLPRAVVFDAEIMRVFDSIGLADAISDVTRPLGGSIYLGADGRRIRTFHAPPPANAFAWHPSNMFFQPQLEGILRAGLDRFPNVTVLQRTELTAVTQDQGDLVRLETVSAAGHIAGSITAEIVLACDGASSSVRKALDIPLDDIGFEERWLVVDTFVNGAMRWPDAYDVPVEVREGRYSLMVCDPGRPCTLIPGVGSHRRWEYMLFPGEHADDAIPDGWLRALLSNWVDPDDVELVRSAIYRFRALVARQWRIGSILLLGDAAHQTPPFYGQGMCHGIRDAAQLIWKLALMRDGVASAAILDTYQPERDGHVRAIIAASVAAGAAVCVTDPVKAAARDEAFRAIERERAGRPVAISDIVPPIRAGLIDAKSGGARFPELSVATPGGGCVRADHLLSARVTIFASAGFDIGRHRTFADLIIVPHVQAEHRDSAEVSAWLVSRAAAWVMVRPDRYIYASGVSQTDLDDALAGLEHALRMPAPARSPSITGENSV